MKHARRERAKSRMSSTVTVIKASCMRPFHAGVNGEQRAAASILDSCCP